MELCDNIIELLGRGWTVGFMAIVGVILAQMQVLSGCRS